MTTPAADVRVEGLSHRYGASTVLALDDVALRVQPGTRLGLLGPNGAGKSTLMRLLCGYLPVQQHGRQARVEVAGFDVVRDSIAVRRRVGYLPEQVPLYPELRVREHLMFRARIKHVPRRRRSAEIERVAGLTAITDVIHTPIGRLSRGYRQRVGLADALLGAPALVVLDEPTVGLDPNQIREIRAVLRALGGEQTLVFSSHILAEVEALCDRVAILSRGRVVADETVGEALSSARILVTLGAAEPEVAALLAAAWELAGQAPAAEVQLEPADDDGETRVEIAWPRADVSVDAAMAAIGAAAAKRQVAVLRLMPGPTRLEERFAAVTGAAPPGADPSEAAPSEAALSEAEGAAP